jgi:DNA-binding transcriptional regulator/RsmH inhibitor MraZ
MLTRDAMLIGQGLHFELWDEARWNELARGVDVSATDLPPDLGALSL